MRIIKTLIVLFICQITHAKTVELLTALQDEGLFRVEGRFIGDDSKPVHLVGTSKVAKIADSKDKIIRIVWTEVAKKSKKEPKYFANPVMMTMAAPKIAKGTKLTDNENAITSALTNLRTTKSKVKVKDKYSTDRKVLVPVGKDDSSGSSQNGSGAMSVATQLIREGTSTHSKSGFGSLDGRGHDGTIGRGSKGDRQRGSMNDRYRSSTRDRRNTGIDDSGSGSQDRHHTRIDDVDDRGRHHTTLGESESLADTSFDAPKLDTSALSDSISGSDSLIGDGKSSKPGTSPLSGSTSDSDSLTGDGKSSSPKEDNTRIEITSDGCPVRIDSDNDRVIIQNKAVTFKDDSKVSETKCTDSLEHYLIKKNYLCEHCLDFVDLNNMKACPTYERYWTNSEGRKTVLSTQPEKDETQEFPITADDKECSPYLDLDNMTAYQQVEFIYQDRVNARKVAKACHRADSVISTPIVLTMKGCTPTHDFENNWSIAQKKGIFSLDGKEYIAFGCREEGRPIPHDYDVGVCTTNVNIQDSVVSVMGKRYVIIEDAKMYLSDCEPINSDQVLMESVEGCEGQYEHKLDEGRSYLKKRWYWLDSLDKQFVTACIKSTEFLLHKEEVTGHENDDGNKRSKRIVTVYIEPDVDEREDLQTGYINPHSEPIPYELVSTTNEPTDSFAYAGCFKITQTNRYKTYTRGDGTTFKQFLGVGTPLKSGDLCRKTTENKDVYHHTHVWCTRNLEPCFEFDVSDPNDKKYLPRSRKSESLFKVGTAVSRMNGQMIGRGAHVEHRCAKYFKTHTRTIAHYPNGTNTAGSWVDTGALKRGGTYWAAHNYKSGIATPSSPGIHSFRESP